MDGKRVFVTLSGKRKIRIQAIQFAESHKRRSEGIRNAPPLRVGAPCLVVMTRSWRVSQVASDEVEVATERQPADLIPDVSIERLAFHEQIAGAATLAHCVRISSGNNKSWRE